MVKELTTTINPLASILLSYMMKSDSDFFNGEHIADLYYDLGDYLSFILVNQKDVELLDFDIESDVTGDFVEIKPNNLITGLWFCGIFPDNGFNVEKKKEYREDNMTYTYNKRKKEIKIKNG